MTFDELLQFLQNRRATSHICQMLLIRSLIEVDGTATLRQLALQFFLQDENQILCYEERIKKMVLRELSRHNVLSKDGDLVILNVPELTLQQKARIKSLCEEKIREYPASHGLSIMDCNIPDTDPVPDDLYFRVLKEADGRCALCGATKKERPLHVDHIKPPSRGGKTTYENLQVLCSKCNRARSDKDSTDFRGNGGLENIADCRFCHERIKHRVVEEHGTVVAFEDRYPVSVGHHLIVPRRHTPDWFSMTDLERRDAEALIRILKNRLVEADPSITGFNIGVNCGKSAGQTIFHAHTHLIPRRDGDTPDPTGGVRGVIPEKMCYKIHK